MNLIFISVLCSWLLAQIIKVFISKKKRRFFECGGMPSSHSAFVAALTTSAGLLEGFDSSLFLVTLGFSIIVAYDAIKVRKHHTLNQVIIGVAIGIIITLLIQRFFF